MQNRSVHVACTATSLALLTSIVGYSGSVAAAHELKGVYSSTKFKNLELQSNRVYESRGLGEALLVCEKGYRQEGNCAAIHRLKAGLYLGANDYKMAIKELDLAISLAPGDAESYEFRGYLKDVLGDIRGAVEDYALLSKLDPEGGNWNAGRLMVNQRDHRAIKYLDRCIALAPKEYIYRLFRAHAYRQQEQFQKALDDYVEASKLGHFSCWELGCQAFCVYNLGDYRKAIGLYDNAIALNPRNDGWFNMRGRSKEGLDDYAGAKQDYLRALAISPNDPAYIENLAGVECALGNYREAKALISRALVLDPHPGYQPYLLQSGANFKTGDWFGGFRDLAKAVQVDMAKGRK